MELAGDLHEIDPSEFLKSETAPTQINHNQSGGSAANYLNNPLDQLVAAHNETVLVKNETIQTQKDLISHLTQRLEAKNYKAE